MKKLGTYLLLAFYALATFGFSANVHFCSDEVAEIALNSELSDASCGCGDEDESSSCCQEKSFEYKVDTKHLAQALVNQTTKPFAPILTINQPLTKAELIETLLVQTFNFKLGQDPPLRILNCVYRL